MERKIPDFPYYDGMGCYPLFACRHWAELPRDLEDIGSKLVSLSLVTDPFGEYDVTHLRRCFKDVVIPFKKHYIVDLHCSMDSFVSNHHRRYARKSLRHIEVERCQDPTQFTSEWVDLYANLVKRHYIRGIPAFSIASFAQQLEVPGMVLLRATHKETTVGITLWYVQGDVGYYHLGAFSEAGYKLRASFPLFRFAIEYFGVTGLRWLDLGAGAGIRSTEMDGLTRFKRGWSTGTRTAYFCGRIFDRARYFEIANTKGAYSTGYFPIYRQGEFS